jgi:histidine triad (HIT) family protein
MTDSVFTRIILREIPAVFVYEDAQDIAFMDAGQVNPGHVLVATKRQVETVMELEEGEAAHLFAIATRVNRP